MPDNLLFWLILAVASLCLACFGFLVGAVLQSGKVSQLYRQLELMDEAAYDQAQMLSELTDALRLVICELSEQPGSDSNDETLRHAVAALERLGTPPPKSSHGLQ